MVVESSFVCFLWLWNQLCLSLVGSKFHLLKDHLEKQIEEWEAIGAFSEEFCEADHVVGNKEYRTFAGLRADDKKAVALSKNEVMRNNKEVKRIKEEVNPQRKRTRLSKEDIQRVEGMRRDVLDECRFLMQTYGGAPVQIEDYWNKISDIR